MLTSLAHLSSFIFLLSHSHRMCSISQATGAESQAKAARVVELQTELENLTHQISTLGQQIEQYEHASSRAKEEQAKMR